MQYGSYLHLDDYSTHIQTAIAKPVYSDEEPSNFKVPFTIQSETTKTRWPPEDTHPLWANNSVFADHCLQK